ncbi:ABC transporter substrate-binding protein [Bacillus sp. TS-2]|nr:ABC transporter substrate-binding protein [Bacillus sp. TS-2]
MLKIKSKLLVVFITALTLTIVGCSSGDTDNETREEASGDQTVLRVAWWGGQERHDMTLQAIDLFEEKNPDIKVEPEFTSWDGYWERLNTQAAGSNLPDVINMDNSKLNEYHSRGLLLDLSELISAGNIDLENVDDIYQEINEAGDEVLAVAIGANALASLVNEDVMEDHGIQLEPGYTYEELQEAMLEMKEGNDDFFYGFDFANSEFELFTLFARQNQQSVFNEDGTDIGFTEDTLVEYFDFVQTMVNSEASPSHDITMDYVDGGNSMIGEGSAAIQIGASNQIIGQSQSTEHTLGLNLLPSLANGEDANWIRPSMSFAISTNSEKQEAAATFIDFFTNDLDANEILMAERGVPISSEVRSHLEGLVDEPTRKTFEFLEMIADYSSPADPLSPAGETEVRGSFLRIIELVKYDRITPEEAASQFIAEVSSIL